MTDWEGWSKESWHEGETRVLGKLLGSVDETGSTTLSMRQAVDALGMDQVVSSNKTLAALADSHHLFSYDPHDPTPVLSPLQVTDKGARVAAAFRQGSTGAEREQAAQRAVLLWLDDPMRGSMTELNNMLLTPHSWNWGVQWSADELHEAATELHKLGYLDGHRTAGGAVLRPELTRQGEWCVKHFDGDARQMQNSASTGAQVAKGAGLSDGDPPGARLIRTTTTWTDPPDDPSPAGPVPAWITAADLDDGDDGQDQHYQAERGPRL